MSRMKVAADGTLVAIYSDAIPVVALSDALGAPARIERASDVVWDGTGWVADMAKSGGPKLPPRTRRSDAIAAEVVWLEAHRGLGGAS